MFISSKKTKSRASGLIMVWLAFLVWGGFTGKSNAASDDDKPVESIVTMQAPVVLPVEIMGAAGTIETVTVDVNDASGVTGLWMQVHNLSYDNKGSVRINGGNWIDLTNNTVKVAFPEDHVFGIGGGYSTIRITVPLAGGAVINGSNKIDFRFNGTDGLSSGWRVLQFNFVRSNGSKAIPASAFVEDNPADWAPIRTSAADLAQGENLWYNASLTEPNSGAIRAHCTDCHASDARDLKYFNYSDKSIVERAKFHGLSQAQGEQIASWIRSQDYPAPGRPWNPPYQPGPGLDDKPIEEWAAGAGLEWVLEYDSETMDYLFPNGISDNVASTKSILNMRELPLALQFPDWNRWLPPVHPVDFWGAAFENSDANKAYLTMNEAPTGLHDASSKVVLAIQDLDNRVTDWRRNATLPDGKTNKDQAIGNLGIQLWQLVKTWGLMQEYHLEDHGNEVYPGEGEKRTWFSLARNVFNVAPHISSAPGAYTYGTEAMDKFFSHTWYMYQLIINSGNRNPLEHKPVDWKYQFGHIGDYSKHTGLESGARLVASYIKMIQMLDNDKGINAEGWYMRHAHPYWFVRSMAAAPGETNMGIWGSIPIDQHARIAEVLLRSFLKKSLEYDINAWPRGQANHEMEPASYKPKLSTDNGDIFEDRFNYADNFYRIIPEFRERGVSHALLDSLALWGEALWPLGDWELLLNGDGSGSGNPSLPMVGVSVTSNASTAYEPGGTGNKGRFVIARTGDTSAPLTVHFTVAGTAVNGVDYVGISSPVEMSAGQSEALIPVNPIDDDRRENDETVVLTVQTNAAYNISSGGKSGLVTIKDDDSGVPYSSGDTTGDGSISALDAALILQHVAGNKLLSGSASTAADVSGDQSLTAYDAALILQYITGIIDCFPVEAGCTASKISQVSFH